MLFYIYTHFLIRKFPGKDCVEEQWNITGVQAFNDSIVKSSAHNIKIYDVKSFNLGDSWLLSSTWHSRRLGYIFQKPSRSVNIVFFNSINKAYGFGVVCLWQSFSNCQRSSVFTFIICFIVTQIFEKLTLSYAKMDVEEL